MQRLRQQQAQDGFPGTRSLPSWELASIKIRSKTILPNCVDIKTRIFILCIKHFIRSKRCFFFLSEFKRNEHTFWIPQSTGARPCTGLLASSLPGLEAPGLPQPHSLPHFLLLLALGFQFSKLTTDHTPVTYTIREEKLLFLLYNVREFSNLWLWFNLPALVKLPRVELSPNTLVLQNTCKSLRSASSCYNNGQTQGKPKPGAVFPTQWWMTDFYFSFPPLYVFGCKLPPPCFGPWVEYAVANVEKLSSVFMPWNPLCTQPWAFWDLAIISCNVFTGPREFKTCKTWVRKGWYQNPYLFWILV